MIVLSLPSAYPKSLGTAADRRCAHVTSAVRFQRTELYLGLTAVEFSDQGAHQELAAAICARDADAAAKCADHQLSQLLELLQAVAENEK